MESVINEPNGKRMVERRKHILTDDDIDNIIDRLIPRMLTEENIDKFASKFEERWRRFFYIGLGKGLTKLIIRWSITGLFMLAAYGMGKGWNIWK